MPRRTALLLASVIWSAGASFTPAATQQADALQSPQTAGPAGARPHEAGSPSAPPPADAAAEQKDSASGKPEEETQGAEAPQEQTGPQGEALPALDAAPTDGSDPDPLAPPERDEPAPTAPGARALLARALAFPDAPAREADDPTLALVRSRLAERSGAGRADERDDLAGLKAFYGENGARPLWISGDGLNERADRTMAEIRNAGAWGLDARAFVLPEQTAGQTGPEILADAEIKLSLAALKYARHARGGRLNPPALSRAFDRKPRIYDPKTVLQGLASAEAPDAYLRSLHPRHEAFEHLRQALNADVGAAAPGAEIKVPAGPDLRPGARHPHVALLRRRLAVAAAGDGALDDVYDDTLAEAVKAFQKEHDLKPTGVINGRLRAALNETGEDSGDARRLRLLANMERWRWMPDELGDFYVMNNIPEQITRVYESGRRVLMEKIVVGKPNSPTPSFSANMQFVIFHPEWNVPDGIKTKELGPQLRRGGASRVMRAHGLRVLYNGREVDPDSIDWSSTDVRRFQFVQPSGGRNVLGVVKFRFPNKHDVYMHDTSERRLFEASRRTFSHGCMRVQNPVHLAETLLGHDKGWTAARVRQIADQRGGQNEITLSRPIPVHIVYFTASVDETGRLQSYPDVYGLDKTVIAALKGQPTPDASEAATATVDEERSRPRPRVRSRERNSEERRSRESLFFWD